MMYQLPDTSGREKKDKCQGCLQTEVVSRPEPTPFHESLLRPATVPSAGACPGKHPQFNWNWALRKPSKTMALVGEGVEVDAVVRVVVVTVGQHAGPGRSRAADEAGSCLLLLYRFAPHASFVRWFTTPRKWIPHGY